MRSMSFDMGFDLGLKAFVGGWTFNSQILQNNNHVHLNI
jgi:hypothetical protein